VIISAPTLLPGAYTLSAGIFDSSGSFLDWADSVARIEVLPQFADGRPFDHRLGIVTQELQWRINE
jgi:lipopolysaccharide transport system ATP-binding protein